MDIYFLSIFKNPVEIEKIFVIEDHINMGGLSSIIKEFAWENDKHNKITFINLGESFFRPGNFSDAIQNTELAVGKIYGKIINHEKLD